MQDGEDLNIKTEPSNLTRLLLVGGTIFGLYLYSMTVFMLGVLLPELTLRFSLSAAEQGRLFLVLNAAIFLAVYLAGPVINAIGQRPVVLVGALAAGLAFAAIGQVRSWPWLAFVLFFLGLGAGAINIACNTLIPDLYPQRPAVAFSLANIFFGLGGITLPFMSSLWLDRLGLERFMVLVACFSLPPVLFLAWVRTPCVRKSFRFGFAPFAAVFRLPLYSFFALVFFFYGGLEVTTAGWLKTYLIDHRHLAAAEAGWLLTAFSCTLLVGRLAGSYVLARVAEIKAALCAAAVTGIGLLVLTHADQLLWIRFSIAVTGLALAPIFPAALGLVSKLFKNNKDMVIGTLLGWGIFGGVVTPYLLGHLGGDMQYTLAVVTCLFIVQLMLSYRLQAADLEYAE